MFGLSFGEIIVLLVVGIVVVGPKNLPGLMRTAGQWVGKARRLSFDLRSQSGIDDLIRKEGLEREIHELRSLARMNVVDSLINPAAAFSASSLAPLRERPEAAPPDFKKLEPLREREFPLVGCDAGDALADDAVVYPPAPVPEAPKAEDAAPAKTNGLVVEPAIGTVAWSATPLLEDAPRGDAATDAIAKTQPIADGKG